MECRARPTLRSSAFVSFAAVGPVLAARAGSAGQAPAPLSAARSCRDRTMPDEVGVGEAALGGGSVRYLPGHRGMHSIKKIRKQTVLTDMQTNGRSPAPCKRGGARAKQAYTSLARVEQSHRCWGLQEKTHHCLRVSTACARVTSASVSLQKRRRSVRPRTSPLNCYQLFMGLRKNRFLTCRPSILSAGQEYHADI